MTVPDNSNVNEVIVKDRKFIVKKINARTGAFMAFKVGGIIAPLLGGLNQRKIKSPIVGEAKLKEAGLDLGGIDFASIGAGLSSLKEEDFNYVYDKCLQLCFENLPAGATQVMNDSGQFGVMGLEYDAAATLALVVHALMFNVAGFFDGNPLAGALGGLITKWSAAKM